VSGPEPPGLLRVPDRPAQLLDRLIETLEARGHALDRSGAGGATLVVGPTVDGAGLPADRSGCTRVLVVSLIGAHPDARAPLLHDLWALEEEARTCGLPALVIRLGPLIGPRSPLWRMFASRPALPRGGRHLLCPVAEEDVVASLDRALTGRVAWHGWYEACGAEALTMAELSAMAAAHGGTDGVAPAWEPPLEVLLEQRLAESGPWCAHFGLEPAPIARRIAAWAA